MTKNDAIDELYAWLDREVEENNEALAKMEKGDEWHQWMRGYKAALESMEEKLYAMWAGSFMRIEVD